MGQMRDGHQELLALREATLVALSPKVVEDLEAIAGCYAKGDLRDRKASEGLRQLLELHTKLEAIRGV